MSKLVKLILNSAAVFASLCFYMKCSDIVFCTVLLYRFAGKVSMLVVMFSAYNSVGLILISRQSKLPAGQFSGILCNVM